MKKIVTFLIVLMMCGMLTAFADDGGYTITEYQWSGVLHENNVLSVTETIDVNFEDWRHGIYRSIPKLFYVGQPDGTATKYYGRVNHISVKEDDFKVEDGSEYCDIRIGDEDEYKIDDYSYEISYQYRIPDDRIADRDFLFYSVLGSEWNTTIDHFSFELSFDKELPEQSVSQFQVYSGQFGDTANALDVKYTVTKNTVSGEVSNIAPQRSITLYTDLPQGYFVGAYRRPVWPAVIAAILTLVLEIFGGYQLLTVKSKNPVQTVEFYPPDGISSAEVGYIIDSSADAEDLLSLIPWWADHGYLTIKEIPDRKGRGGKHSKLILHKIKNLPQSAPQYMQILFQGLFGKRDTCDVEKLGKNGKFADKMDAAKELLKVEFVGERRLFSHPFRPLVLTLILNTAFSAVLGTINAATMGDGMLWAIAAWIVLTILAFLSWNYRFHAAFSGRAKQILRAAVAAICILVYAGIVTLGTRDSLLPAIAVWVLGILALMVCLTCGRLVQPTDYNVEITGKLLGLKEFIKTAEMPRLRMLMDENPSYYYNILPYAMVFGLSDHWAKQFKSLEVAAPNWYQGNVSMFDVYYFNAMMRHSISQPINHSAQLAAAKSTASLSGGGGFSGGGGGGGGGGSW